MKIVILLVLFPFALPTARAKEWRGIIPLHSTRSDVERVLGPSTTECKCAYYLEDVNIFLSYSRGGCKSGETGGWNVPLGTVIRFTVVPKYNLNLSDLKIDEKKFKVKEDLEVKGWVYYNNEEEGWIISVWKETGLVASFYYEPAAKDFYLKCSS